MAITKNENEESLSSTGFDSQGKWQARDLWRQQDLGVHEDKLNLDVPSHGCLLVRLWPLKAN